MSKECKRTFLKCSICGLVVEKMGEGISSIPVCCGKEMEKLQPKKEDMGKEKHVPFGETAPDGNLLVKVGESAEHPMTEEHHILWIQCCYKGRSTRIYLDHTDKPRAHFCCKPEKGMVLLEYCNIHGLWEGEVK